jgi:NADH:ubiquinone oxidoreductase subunit 3 (subunit A)
MQSFFQEVLAQANTVPNSIKPWEENPIINLVVLAFMVVFLVLIWLWARSGRSKRENQVPFERTTEDFAGQIQSADGRLPAFLIVLYVILAVCMAGYVINSIITGVKY